MPMDKEEYEKRLNELVNPELEHSRRTEILQELRVDYTTVHTDFDDLTKTTTKLQKYNSDLVISNSQLFRQLGTAGDPKKEEEVEQKEFSETVTLEQLEKSI